MAKIPYYFETPVPIYFREHGWFDNENTFKFVTWAFSKCSSETRKTVIQGKEITLEPFEFIAGRLSSPKECYMTEKQWRGQLFTLLQAGILKKTANSKSNKYSCYVWVVEMFTDNNKKEKVQQKGQQRANRGPTEGHNLEYKNIRIEEEIQITPTPSLPISPKIKFKEFVELTQTEYDSLLTKHGQEFLNRMLDILDAYKGSSGKKYASDYHTMKLGGWVYNRAKQDQERTHEKSFRSPAKTPPGNNANAEPTKFQPNRILRINNAIEGDQRVVHD